MAHTPTATDLSPLHWAILERSSSKVSHLLATKSDIISYPYASILTPMECALGWPEGLHLLAAVGATPISAIKLAAFRCDVDSVAAILYSDSPIFHDNAPFSEVYWNGISISNMLEAILCSHCGLTEGRMTCRRRRSCCGRRTASIETFQDKISRLLADTLKERRTMLSRLALEYLPAQKLGELRVRSDSPLDSAAFATYTALQEWGVNVPRALYPGKRPLLSSFNILCQSGGLLLARALFGSGVAEVDLSVDGVSLLESLLWVDLADGRKEATIQWLLDNGARAAFVGRDKLPNFLFYLASVYDTPDAYPNPPVFRAMEAISNRVFEVMAAPEEQETTPTMIGLVARYCNPVARDSCCCLCSSGGCMPLHKFKNGLPVRLSHCESGDYCHAGDWIAKRWTSVSETLYSWMRDCQLDEAQTRQYLHDACQLEVFTRLGMAHTCCLFQGRPSRQRFPIRQERDDEVCRELRDEDEELAEQLEIIMKGYDTALSTHRGTISEF